MDTKTKRVRKVFESIRTILVGRWGPLGINGSVNLRDECDRSIPGIYRLLVANASENEIMQFLAAEETAIMGSVAVPGNCCP
jgi:hypothetical protein